MAMAVALVIIRIKRRRSKHGQLISKRNKRSQARSQIAV